MAYMYFRPNRAKYNPEKADFEPEWADLGPERTDSGSGREAWRRRTDSRMYAWTDRLPCPTGHRHIELLPN